MISFIKNLFLEDFENCSIVFKIKVRKKNIGYSYESYVVKGYWKFKNDFWWHSLGEIFKSSRDRWDDSSIPMMHGRCQDEFIQQSKNNFKRTNKFKKTVHIREILPLIDDMEVKANIISSSRGIFYATHPTTPIQYQYSAGTTV